MRFTRPAILMLILLLPLAGACTSNDWAERADRDAEGIVAEKSVGFDDFRNNDLILPGEEPAEVKSEELDLSDVPETVGLGEALNVATKRNREYATQKESLFLAALALTNTRNQFSPFFSSTVSALLTDTDRTGRNDNARINFGVSQVLPTGGNVSVGVNGNKTAGELEVFGGENYSAGLAIDFDQPLLRNAGYESSHESLTQGERNVVYAIRDFELYREDFTIGIATQFYNLVRQMREIVNAEKDLESKKILKEQSEEKFKVGLATVVSKLRAARQYLTAQSALLTTKEAYDLSLDRFKIQLGLPTSFPLTIRSEEPEFSNIPVNLRKAVAAALHNRVDLISSRDRVEDAERKLDISINQLLPDLDLNGSYRNDTGDTTTIRNAVFGNYGWTLGVTLEIPLERTSERNAMRRRMVELGQSKRGLTLAEDNVILQVRDSYRSLRRTETSLEIRRQEIDVASLEYEAAQIRFEAGEADNLAVTEAQNAVLRAENSYIRDLVSYEISRVQLLRYVGILFLDEHGMWREP